MIETASTSEGMLPSAGRNPSRIHDIAKPKAETRMPFATNGSARPEKIASRLAGVARSGWSVPYCRSLAIPIVMP